MIHQQSSNFSPILSLETSRYLTDPAVIREYRVLQDLQFRERSVLERLWRRPKFRTFVIRLSRLMIFSVLLFTAIGTISSMGWWRDLHHALITAL